MYQAVRIVIVSLFLVAGGCESRFVESAPDKVNNDGMTLSERVELKASIDARILEVEQNALKIKDVLSRVLSFGGASAAATPYSPVDFLINSSMALHESFPQKVSGEVRRDAIVVLQLPGVSAACSIVQTRSVSSKSTGEDGVVTTTIDYLMKVCGDVEFVPAAHASWSGNGSLELEMLSANIRSGLGRVFENAPEAVIENALSESTCSINADADPSNGSSISCEAMEIKISTSKSAVIRSLLINAAGPLAASGTIEILDNDVLQTAANFTLERGQLLPQMQTIRNEKP
jgi:hypothetical protein